MMWRLVKFEGDMDKMRTNIKKKLTRIYEGREVLCEECKTRCFQSTGNKKKYGVIPVHKKNCNYINNLKENSVEV